MSPSTHATKQWVQSGDAARDARRRKASPRRICGLTSLPRTEESTRPPDSENERRRGPTRRTEQVSLYGSPGGGRGRLGLNPTARFFLMATVGAAGPSRTPDLQIGVRPTPGGGKSRSEDRRSRGGWNRGFRLGVSTKPPQRAARRRRVLRNRSRGTRGRKATVRGEPS